MKKSFIFFLIAVVIASPFISAGLIFGPTTVFADFDCLSLTASSTPDQKSYCQDQIVQLEAQLQVLNNQLAGQKAQSGSLQGDVNHLTTQINAKKLAIKATQLKVAQLSDSITEKQTTIQTLNQKIQIEKDSIAQLIRKTDEMDRTTMTTFFLSSKSLSEFYSDVSAFNALKKEVKASVDEISTIKGVTQQNETELQKQQDQTINEKQNLQSAQAALAQNQATQKQLLSISKGKESQYQQVITAQQAKVSQIKAKLFSLAGGSQAIRFDIALQYANQAKTKTGIDPAYLLAELTQESNLGANVGQCYLTNQSTGAGANVKTGKTYTNVMKPTRDVQPFIDITGSLGFDWQKTVVSCPIAGVAGYGGAMGPAQFIASTWQLFVPRLKADLGVSIPNPWSAPDAFMAASLYLTDLGGVGTSAAAQLRASCKYYGSGGSTCSYGRSVQTLKLNIQSNIDYLNQYGVSKQ